MTNKRCLTIIEGRECNQRLAQELIDAAAKAGWETQLIKYITMNSIADGSFRDLFSDYVIWRGLGSREYSRYGAARVIAYLNATNKVTINTRIEGGLGCTSNKFFQHGLFLLDDDLAEHSLPMYRATSKQQLLDLIEAGKVNYPFCLKPEYGTRGEGILLIRQEADIPERIVEEMSTEPFIKSQYTWRVFVLDGKPLGAMRKSGDPDNEANFRAYASGSERVGETDPKIVEELHRLAVKAAKVSGLDYTGVDFLRDDETGKFYICETNFAASWRNGFLDATGISIPDEIMQFFEKKYLEREKQGK